MVMSEDTLARQQANKEKLTRLLNAGQVRDFLESRLRREVSTKEIAACMVLLDKQDAQTREATLKEVEMWLRSLVSRIEDNWRSPYIIQTP